jgi:hypothetical protein
VKNKVRFDRNKTEEAPRKFLYLYIYVFLFGR